MSYVGEACVRRNTKTNKKPELHQRCLLAARLEATATSKETSHTKAQVQDCRGGARPVSERWPVPVFFSHVFFEGSNVCSCKRFSHNSDFGSEYLGGFISLLGSKLLREICISILNKKSSLTLHHQLKCTNQLPPPLACGCCYSGWDRIALHEACNLASRAYAHREILLFMDLVKFKKRNREEKRGWGCGTG